MKQKYTIPILVVMAVLLVGIMDNVISSMQQLGYAQGSSGSSGSSGGSSGDARNGDVGGGNGGGSSVGGAGGYGSEYPYGHGGNSGVGGGVRGVPEPVEHREALRGN